MGNSNSKAAKKPAQKTAPPVDTKAVRKLEEQLRLIEEMKGDLSIKEIADIKIDNNSVEKMKTLEDKCAKYKQNPTAYSFLETVSAHISLVTQSGVSSFKKSMEKVKTLY